MIALTFFYKVIKIDSVMNRMYIEKNVSVLIVVHAVAS